MWEQDIRNPRCKREGCPWNHCGTVYLHLGPFYWDGEPGGHINHAGVRVFGRRIGIRDTN